MNNDVDFNSMHEECRKCCEDAIKLSIDTYFQKDSLVSEAAGYALRAGGKRVRGVLTLATCQMMAGNHDAAAVFSAAIEMVHAFSLIHDDLPCMDDDDMRRGLPSTHIKYGEANALLAGDLLAIEAFNAISCAPCPAEISLNAARILSSAAGAKGMIYGQELDLKYETETADEKALRLVHKNKTGALIKAAVELGLASAGGTFTQHPKLLQYAENLGLVFQITDDILDVESDIETLGKPVGSDVAQGKTTFVTMFGLEHAKNEVQRLTQEATEGLAAIYGDNSNFMSNYAKVLATRIY